MDILIKNNFNKSNNNEEEEGRLWFLILTDWRC